MEESKYKGWAPALIDNKSISEDIVDDLQMACASGNHRSTFWRDESLYLMEYLYCGNTIKIMCVYGPKSVEAAKAIKEDIDKMMKEVEAENRYVCEVLIDGCEVYVSFYWKPEGEAPLSGESREEKVLEMLSTCHGFIDFERVTVKVSVKDEYGDKVCEKYVDFDYASDDNGELVVSGDPYQVPENYSMNELPLASQNDLYQAIFAAFEAQRQKQAP